MSKDNPEAGINPFRLGHLVRCDADLQGNFHHTADDDPLTSDPASGSPVESRLDSVLPQGKRHGKNGYRYELFGSAYVSHTAVLS